MKKYIPFIKGLLLLVFVAFLYGFSSSRNKAKRVEKVNVSFENGDNLFITYETVNKLLIQNYGRLQSQPKERVQSISAQNPDIMSYRNTIDFRTPDQKITMCETTLQSLLRFLCIISRFKLQQSVILRQHLHLANSNGVELCQPFRLRYSFINEHGIQIFQV